MDHQGLPPHHTDAVLVTGAGGRIGGSVVEWLLGKDIPVRGVDRHPPAAGHPSVTWFTGDAADVGLLDDALRGCSAVVHLAGLTHWSHGNLGEVLGTNLAMTATVVDRAVSAGVRRIVVASSIQANGVEGNPRVLLPSAYPIAVTQPSVAVDGYSLSKLYGENAAVRLTAGTATRVTSLRFPLTLPEAELRTVAAEWADDPAAGAALGWSYLDVRDAARAVGAALEAPPHEAGALLVAAPNNLIGARTEDLLDCFAPGVTRHRRFVGDEVPLDLRPAAEVLGFHAQFETRSDT